MLALVAAPLEFAPAAAAQPADDPAAAYEAGQRAFDAKDYAAAAHAFARADELAPSDAALEAALKTALLADDPALGLALVERADGRAVGRGLKPLVERAKKTFEGRAGRLVIRCPAAECSVTVDGAPSPAGKPAWFRVGPRAVVVTMGPRVQRETVEVRGGTTVELVAAAPMTDPGPIAAPPPLASSAPLPAATGSNAAPPPVRSTDDVEGHGISPVFFVVTTVATAVLAGVTIWSGVDTLGLHDDFDAGDASARAKGIDAQLRTNVLIGVTAGGAVATVVLAFTTDFGGGEPVSTTSANRSTLSEPPPF